MAIEENPVPKNVVIIGLIVVPVAFWAVVKIVVYSMQTFLPIWELIFGLISLSSLLVLAVGSFAVGLLFTVSILVYIGYELNDNLKEASG